MKKNRKFFGRVLTATVAALMLMGAAFALTSCSEDQSEGQNISVYFVGEIYDFDPALAYVNDRAVEVMNMIYEPLFRLDRDGELQNALADSYRFYKEEGENKLEIVLEETYWSDGTKVKADDVVYAWKRILDPDFESQACAMLYDIKNAMKVKLGDGCTVDDLGLWGEDDTVTITFEKKYDEKGNEVEIDQEAFLRNLTSVALVPLRESVVSVRDSIDQNNDGTIDYYGSYWAKRVATLITNGPFKVVSLDYTTGEFTLGRNAYYRREKGSTTAPTKYVLPNQLNTVWKPANWEASAGSPTYLTDIIGQYVDNVVFYMGDADLDARSAYRHLFTANDIMSTTTAVINSNTRDVGLSKVLSNAKFRRAMSMALDRTEIVNSVVFAKPATGLISNGVWDSTDAKTSFRSVADAKGALISATADMTEAKKLAEEGIREALSVPKTDGAGTYYDEYLDKSLPLYLEITYDKNDPEATRVAEILRDAWKNLGLTSVTLRGLDSSTSTVTFAKGTYDEDAIINVDALQNAYATGNFQVIIMDYQMFSTNAFTALSNFSTTYSGNGIDMLADAQGNRTNDIKTHICGYSSEAYDALIEKAFAERDLTKRAVILHEAEEMLMQDMPVIPLYFNQNFYVASDKLTDLETDYYGFVSFREALLKED